VKAGKTRQVASLEIADGTQTLVEIAVWDNAYGLLENIPVGEGITIIGLTATKEGSGLNSTKLNMWDSAHVLQGGDTAQSLTSLGLDAKSCSRITPVFTGPLLPLDSEALPTCAVALANAPKSAADKVIQINRCMIDAPTQREHIFTQDGKRLYAVCRCRDWTGGVDVEVVSEAVPSLYGCTDQDGVEQALAAGTLQQTPARVNARGVLKSGDGARIFIGKIIETPLDAKVSGDALRDCLGLSDISGDVAMAAPAKRVHDAPLVGLSVASDHKGYIGAHRVLLLVKGNALHN
jgi:hypothetical protein